MQSAFVKLNEVQSSLRLQ